MSGMQIDEFSFFVTVTNIAPPSAHCENPAFALNTRLSPVEIDLWSWLFRLSARCDSPRITRPFSVLRIVRRWLFHKVYSELLISQSKIHFVTSLSQFAGSL